MDLFLGFLFCFNDICVCFYASTKLFRFVLIFKSELGLRGKKTTSPFIPLNYINLGHLEGLVIRTRKCKHIALVFLYRTLHLGVFFMVHSLVQLAVN